MNLRRALKKIDKASVEEADPALLQSLRDTWPWSYPGVRALLEHDGLDTSFSTFIRASALSDWHGFQPLAPQLCDEGGEFIVRKIIKLEELEKEWPPLLESLGIPERPLATRNASRSENEPPPNDISEPGDIAFIRDRFEIDFRRLGYHPDDVPAGV
jgi:hypothetical protein